MESKAPNTLTKAGKTVTCPICGYDRFHTREALLNTRGLTFFNLDWANKKAAVYVCDQCGHCLWFLED